METVLEARRATRVRRRRGMEDVMWSKMLDSEVTARADRTMVMNGLKVMNCHQPVVVPSFGCLRGDQIVA